MINAQPAIVGRARPAGQAVGAPGCQTPATAADAARDHARANLPGRVLPPRKGFAWRRPVSGVRQHRFFHLLHKQEQGRA